MIFGYEGHNPQYLVEHMRAVIHWFRLDLRLADNPALSAAVRSGQPFIAVYVLDDEIPGSWAPGGASRWWLHHSLAAWTKRCRPRAAGSCCAAAIRFRCYRA